MKNRTLIIYLLVLAALVVTGVHLKNRLNIEGRFVRNLQFSLDKVNPPLSHFVRSEYYEINKFADAFSGKNETIRQHANAIVELSGSVISLIEQVQSKQLDAGIAMETLFPKILNLADSLNSLTAETGITGFNFEQMLESPAEQMKNILVKGNLSPQQFDLLFAGMKTQVQSTVGLALDAVKMEMKHTDEGLYDQWIPYLHAESEAKTNAPFKAEIQFLGYFSTVDNIKIKANGENIPLVNGMGTRRCWYHHAGRSKEIVEIDVIDPLTNAVKRYTKTFETDVLNP